MNWKVSISAALALLLTTTMAAQENGIADGTLTTCDGFLVDTGLSAADYSNNEDITMTICPLAPETITNLYWNLFNIGEGDVMEIYDGDDTSAPLIGTYTGNELQAMDITASDTNPTGCLTLHWVSDASDVGNFTAEISCGLPCIRPLAAVDIDGEIPWRICPGQEITIDATPTEFAEGTSLGTFEWDFDDGATNDSDWPVVTHTFEEPGDYTIQLSVVDDIECANNNLIDLLVLVATEPSFAGSTEELHLCLGQEAGLNGEVAAPTWTGNPGVDFGGALFIPDDQSQCFSSELTLGSFEPGQTIEEVDDIENFFINFEHSYMGDLTISFICPNGQSIAVHQQGGNGTYLGEPVDNEAQSEVPGVGYDYYWSPDATLGTWAEESGGTLPSGTYSSVDPWTNLIGCPLNGTWEVEICDSWAIDNGFIFDWAVEFDPSLYPEAVTFTPSFGPDCDSTYWEGPNITSNGDNCSQVLIQPEETGTFEYTFTGINNHGCTYTHTAEVIVSQVEVDAGEDLVICNEDPVLDGTATIDDPFFTNWTFEWTPDDNLNDGSLEDPTVVDLGQTTTYTFTAYPAGIPACATSDEVIVALEEADPIVLNVPDVTSPCPGDEVTLVASASGGLGSLDYAWSDGLGNDLTASDDPDETTVYTFSAVDECGLTESVDVTVNVINPGTEITADPMLICAGGTNQIMNIIGGTGNYTFTTGVELDLVSQFGVLAGEPGTYVINVVDDCIATGAIDVEVIQCEIIIPNVFTPDGNITVGDNDFFVIDGLEYFPGSKLTIFNRWGNIVLEDEDYKNNWSPVDVSEGTYYYILEVAMPDLTTEFHSGHFTLLNKE